MPGAVRLLVVTLLSGCASEVIEYDSGSQPAKDRGSAASAGSGGAEAGAGGKGGSTSKSSGGTSSGGAGGAGASSSRGGSPSAGSGGKAGAGAGGSSAEGGSTAGSAGDAAGGAGEGGASPGAGACDESAAQVLSAMQSVTTVAADACLKVEFNADQQTWVHSITLQPSAGTYPFSFNWSNCDTQGSGAFGANYGNQVLSPVDPSCPVFIQLTGPGQSIEVQWWAS